mmetsp:Transcript_15274/g.61422  ORF Transcript_15274/g.61422 Transcript_15274/m.61422 type:complete len:207 (-) Transcript_15274:143-763(-)
MPIVEPEAAFGAPPAPLLSSSRHKYATFFVLLAVYTVGLVLSKPLAVRLASLMRWQLRHTRSYKTKTKWTAPIVGLPLLVAALDGSSASVAHGWHWWCSGVALVGLSITFHGELVRDGWILRVVQRCDQTVAAYHFAYHLWLALCVGSVVGLVFLSLVVGFYFWAWIEAYTHVGVHICGAIAGLVIVVAQMELGASVSHIPFVLAH